MNNKISALYQKSVDRRVQAGILYLTIATILLVSTGGVVSSSVMFLLVAGGLAALWFDSELGEALRDPNGLRSMVILLLFVLLWQGLGLLLRDPKDSGAVPVLGSAIGIAMLLPILFGAAKRETVFWSRLMLVLFGLGSVAAAVSLVRYSVVLSGTKGLSLTSLLGGRLIPVGRADHQILGAGGLAACFFAGLALLTRDPLRFRSAMVVGLLLILVTVVLTQSRGPILGIGLGMLAAYATEHFGSETSKTRIAFALAFLCFLVPVSLVIMEPWLKDLVCTSRSSICRPSARQDVWTTVLRLISERPWFGVGPTYRFTGGAVSHPHNGLLGLAFFFGVPIAMAFIGIVWAALRQTLKAPRSVQRTFALMGIFFSISFMATDLSNPFGFVNTHYLYLWLPVFVGSVAGSLRRDGASTLEPLRRAAE
jgi:O-antigen ligase